ncbi:MAG: energy transducer TonB [Proteobacteria bacterium]|nr:energy transducer TonB [Pseudomonadota bacterium]
MSFADQVTIPNASLAKSSTSNVFKSQRALLISVIAHLVIIFGVGFALTFSVSTPPMTAIEVVISTQTPVKTSSDLFSPIPDVRSPTVDTRSDNPQITQYRTQIAEIEADVSRISRERFITSHQTPDDLGEWMARWRQAVEGLGQSQIYRNGSAPMTGDVLLMISVGASGAVRDTKILASSGNKQLDQFAQNIAINAAPYDPLPGTVQSATDTLHITRTWRFEPSGTILTGE